MEYCEWILWDYRTLAPKDHETYWRIPSKKGVLNFCPICGKPIVIEGKPINEYLEAINNESDL